MKQYEVRVHYAANNTVSEDSRWMRIAQGTINFKPARKFRLSDTIVDTSKLETLTSKNTSLSPSSTQPIIITSGSEVSSQSQTSLIENAEAASEAIPQKVTKRKAGISFDEQSPDAAKRTKRTSFARTKKGLNPAFKNPIARYMRTRKSSRSSQKTPRSQSASETTVVVPVTESPKRRRTRSNLDWTEDGVEKTCSPGQCLTSRIDETSFIENSANLSSSIETRPLAASRYSAEDYSFEIHKYPGNQEQLHASDHHVPQSIVQNQNASLAVLHEDFGESELDMGTWTAPLTQGFRPRTPTATTVTPSDVEDYIDDSSPLAQKRTANNYTPLIDLTSPPDNDLPQVTRRDVLGPVSSPIPTREEPSRPSETATKVRHEILALPRRVMCNTMHTVKSRPFDSFLPPYLLELAEGFGLVNHFRPALAPVSIRNSERGYWNLRIQVSDTATVARSRRSPMTSSQWSDKRFMMRQEGLLPAVVSTADGDDALGELVYPNLDPKTYTPWTAGEFKTFWSYLEKVVERGRAGYDVRATLKCSEPVSGDLHVDVKLYGYSETLSHLWLVLYGVSSTLTATMPLQWCVPGAGPLITMSGQVKRGGAVGRWVSKGHGVDGSWGLEEDWDGLSSARNLGDVTNSNRR